MKELFLFSNDKFEEEYRTASGSLSQTPEVKKLISR